MKNFEKFETEIMHIVEDGHTFAVVNGKPVNCMTATCNSCELPTNACFKDRYRWMFSEYKERHKLTKQERKFCELFEGKDVWVARDKSGNLYLYDKKPYKECNECNEIWFANIRGNTMDGIVFKLAEIKFYFIKWEDEEPWSIEELLKLEVEE